MSGIRIIGSLSQGNMSPGSPVKLTRCGLDKDNSPTMNSHLHDARMIYCMI